MTRSSTSGRPPRHVADPDAPDPLRNRLLLAAASHAAKPPEACPQPPLRSLPLR
jgi:hypothetical protein